MVYSKQLTAVFIMAMLPLVGCSRAFYRQQADRDVACMIAQKSNDPRWELPEFSIQIDPRSRYYDPYDPDAQPMPEDDPASHLYMRCVDGKSGWAKWACNGYRDQLENPAWRDRIGEYATLNENGEIVLTLDAALRIAYVHSTDHQQVLETLYLSALDVTTERFRFDTQFFGGTDSTFRHLGRLRSGGESNSLTQDTDLEMRKRFATAGEMVVGFANQFVWQFAGPDTNSAFSILNFSLVQPLLRGAGRDIALEQLTIVERALLANLRAYKQWKQGFFSEIAIGESGVAGPRRRGGFFGGTGLSGFTGQGSGGFGGVGAATGFGRGGGGGGGAGGAAGGGFAGGGVGNVGGFLGLLQTTQQIRNSKASLNLQMGTLNLLESSLDAGIIDLTQVDQFRQSIETARAGLLQSENGLRDSLEFFKMGTLGLPPDLPVVLDDSLIEPFQLIETETTELQDAITAEQVNLGLLGAMPTPDEMQTALTAAQNLEVGFDSVYEAVQRNLAVLNEARPQRESTMTETERSLFTQDVQQLESNLGDLRNRFEGLSADRARIEQNVTNAGNRASTDQLVVWLRELLGIVQEMSLVQARAKVESVAVEPIDLEADRAFEIAMANRLDIMNNRASLVDTWRLIQFNADALQSNLDVFFEGDLQTVGDNPAEFRAPTGSMRAGLRFDAPFTRLLERNNYRQQLIEYQQARRELIQAFDGVFLGLRSRLRNLAILRTNLEIQRRASIIAIRRVDSTREDLNEPQAPAQPGQPATQLGPTAATNLLTALNDLQGTQDAFMSVYLSYYANRMLLQRDLGTMVVDDEGKWVEAPLDGSAQAATMPMGFEGLDDETPMVPPALPEHLQEIIDAQPPTNEPTPAPARSAEIQSRFSGQVES